MSRMHGRRTIVGAIGGCGIYRPMTADQRSPSIARLAVVVGRALGERVEGSAALAAALAEFCGPVADDEDRDRRRRALVALDSAVAGSRPSDPAPLLRDALGEILGTRRVGAGDAYGDALKVLWPLASNMALWQLGYRRPRTAVGIAGACGEVDGGRVADALWLALYRGAPLAPALGGIEVLADEAEESGGDAAALRWALFSARAADEVAAEAGAWRMDVDG